MSDLVDNRDHLSGILARTRTNPFRIQRIHQFANDKHTAIFAIAFIYIRLLTDILIIELRIRSTQLIWITLTRRIETRHQSESIVRTGTFQSTQIVLIVIRNHHAPIHGIRLGLCILAGYGPDQLRTTFVVKSEYVRPIRFQCILSVLTVDNVLADLGGFGKHLLADIRLGIEIQTSLQSCTGCTMDRTGFHPSQLFLDRKIRNGYFQ